MSGDEVMSGTTGFAQGRSAIVTGAGGGMGEAIARRLAAAGARVTAVDVKPANPELLAAGEVDYRQLDLTNGAAFAELARAHPVLDFLVNAAGVCWFDRDGSALDIEDETWDAVLRINLEAARRLTAAMIEPIRAGQGRSIVHVASISGLRAMDEPMDAYQVSKAALISLSRGQALKLAPEGIRVNTVCPGAILTPMIAHLYEGNDARRQRMIDRTPLRRLGTPDDIASAVMFLLSPEASFITASDLVVDGGWMAQVR